MSTEKSFILAFLFKVRTLKEGLQRALRGLKQLAQLQRETHTHTSFLITSCHLSISSVEFQQTVSDLASFLCVCACVQPPSSWVTFVGQGVAGQITDYCELFVWSFHLSLPLLVLDTFHTLLTYSGTICPGRILPTQVAEQ